jgi:2-amino-4-hydroxy-6-hydroxymethyldihydropteridine diphosphokinase
MGSDKDYVLQIVYLGIGGNQKHTLEVMQMALVELSQLSESPIEISKFYKTSPVGDKNQSHFINFVCRLQTSFAPLLLLQKIEEIEKKLGKLPKPKWATRLIDIDILFYGEKVYLDERLEIPHQHWQQRLFVLIPLRDLTTSISFGKDGEVKVYELAEIIQELSSRSADWVIPLDHPIFK